MRKWLVNSILLLALAGNAAMGMPLHSNEETCSMGEMDCCKKAAMAQSAAASDRCAALLLIELLSGGNHSFQREIYFKPAVIYFRASGEH